MTFPTDLSLDSLDIVDRDLLAAATRAGLHWAAVGKSGYGLLSIVALGCESLSERYPTTLTRAIYAFDARSRQWSRVDPRALPAAAPVSEPP